MRKRRKNFHGNGKALQRTTFGRPEREREREGERGGERERAPERVTKVKAARERENVGVCEGSEESKKQRERERVSSSLFRETAVIKQNLI